MIPQPCACLLTPSRTDVPPGWVLVNGRWASENCSQCKGSGTIIPPPEVARLKDLASKAQAAYEGPRGWCAPGSLISPLDQAFIQAASPSVVLALVNVALDARPLLVHEGQHGSAEAMEKSLEELEEVLGKQVHHE